jgi:hypothetical protein
MGGCVGLTLREPNGTEHRMCRWTNILPWALTNLAFIEERPEHVREILGQWYDMREDWLSNGPGGPFRHRMSSIYGPHPYLAPCEYGLVVVDMVNKVIVTMQAYTKIGNIGRVAFAGENPRDPDSDYQRFRALYDAGRAPTVARWDKASRQWVTSQNPWRRAQDCLRQRDTDVNFPIIMRPYVVENIREGMSMFDRDTPEMVARFRRRVLDLGFKLTDEEERLWSEWGKPPDLEFGATDVEASP